MTDCDTGIMAKTKKEIRDTQENNKQKGHMSTPGGGELNGRIYIRYNL